MKTNLMSILWKKEKIPKNAVESPLGGVKADIQYVSLPPAAEGAVSKQLYYVQSTDQDQGTAAGGQGRRVGNGNGLGAHFSQQPVHCLE